MSLDLQQFFPYRLAVLADAVSAALAETYSERFDLTRPEWRILAALGSGGSIRASDIARSTTLDKMQVSRAVKRLERRGLIAREEDERDRRNKLVHLTGPGRALYERIVPLALEREAEILVGLGSGERAALDRMITDLLARSRSLLTRRQRTSVAPSHIRDAEM